MIDDDHAQRTWAALGALLAGPWMRMTGSGIRVTGSRGFQIGDGGTQVNHF